MLSDGLLGDILKVSKPPEETSLMLGYTDFVCTQVKHSRKLLLVNNLCVDVESC